jgi:hypothetical protein
MKKQHVLLLGSSPMRVTATHPTAGTHEDAGPLEGSRVPLLFSKPRATIPKATGGPGQDTYGGQSTQVRFSHTFHHILAGAALSWGGEEGWWNYSLTFPGGTTAVTRSIQVR